MEYLLSEPMLPKFRRTDAIGAGELVRNVFLATLVWNLKVVPPPTVTDV